MNALGLIGSGARAVKSMGFRGVGKSIANTFNPKHQLGNIMSISKTLMSAPTGNLRNPRVVSQLAKSSLQLYGGLTLATYGARFASGRSMVRNKKGKSDMLPGVPII